MGPRQRFTENPFFVLGIGREATRAEVERAAQKLLAELAIGRESARSYRTPLGPVTRTEELVRIAVSELRDPSRRLAHEAWAEVALSDAVPEAFGELPWLGPLAVRKS